MQLNPLAVIVFGSATVLFFLGWSGLRRRNARGATAFCVLMLACAVYSFGYAFELTVTTLPAMMFWLRVEYLGVPFIPALYVVFAIQHVGADKWLTRPVYGFLFLIPLVTFLLFQTNAYHHLYYRTSWINDSGPLPLHSFTPGSLYWVQMVYISACFFFANTLFLRMRLRVPEPYRKQADVMLVSSVVPWAANIVYLAGYSPWGIDLHPLAFTFSGIGFAWGVFRHRLLDLVPVARATVFEGMRDGVIVLDNRGRIADMNPVAARFLGATEEAIGQPASEVPALGLEHTERILAGTEGRLEFMRGSPECPLWLEMDISTLKDRRGLESGRLIVMRDITERKHAETERLEMERRLLHAQKLESLGLLAGGIAHDFNNLLMVILGNLELARMSIPARSPAHSNITDAAAGAHRAAELSRQMLAYSGKGIFLKDALDLNELVRDMGSLLKVSISKSASLELRLAPELPLVMADSGQMQQIVMNVIINAAEALGEEGGAITVTTAAREYDEKELLRSYLEEKPPAGRFVSLEISDGGCGMDEETRRLLFDPFFSTKSVGRGLGLSAVLGIVRGHDGAIMVDSAPGRGTKVTLLFRVHEEKPVHPEPRAPAVFPSMEGDPALSSGTVLVVDDEDMVREVCEAILRHFGFKVLTAAGGEEALDVFRANRGEIRCVILDLTMPMMDGPTVFGHILAVQPEMPVILASGYSLAEVSRRYGDRGFAGFIQKPYSTQHLYDELRKVLAN
ncbi:MAG TPA: histidine kinase N-terminal 7TM domain-containing protein [Syntrophobacter fumaroxidans]|nr:histidine kinase N-terminal 7TM domain-containing protein [Syntrophobacter fumaroxidans]